MMRWGCYCCYCYCLCVEADIQLTGFGLSATYHADNEYALLSDMKNGYRVFHRIVAALNAETA